MNESELVAGTIDVIKRDGWSQGSLIDRYTKKHCILGAIGKARWGKQWDVDCLRGNVQPGGYIQLMEDELTRSLVLKVSRLLYENLDEKDLIYQGYHNEDDVANDPDGLLIGWNDEILDHLHGEEELVGVLEKVQAEVGIDEH